MEVKLGTGVVAWESMGHQWIRTWLEKTNNKKVKRDTHDPNNNSTGVNVKEEFTHLIAC